MTDVEEEAQKFGYMMRVHELIMSFEVAIHCVSSSTENEEGTNLEGDESRRQRTALAKNFGI